MTTQPRDVILEKLEQFARQRPGLDFANYGDVSAYRSESRSITKDLHHAESLLAAVRRTLIPADKLASAFKRAYSGRLSWDGESLDYCTGQYWPTEYRRAVCAVLSAALWDYFREDCGCDTREKIQAAARRALPRHIVNRWFN